ncbi:hypothetical protein OTU49_000880 [Cherax quadricarinatus]|uniref:KASH domain-containing protein n=1 Tax=Cherax quadricarinatus TaxID=27406 RepID=A0AAW0XVT0_CHEQU
MAARREKIREGRRQADPAFPVLTPPASPVTRPQIPTPQREGHLVPEVNGKGVLKEPISRNKKKHGKGLKVTFDLDNISEYCKYSTPKDENVIDCWEDISDGEAEASGTNYDIREEDIIDCERELDICGDFCQTDGESATEGHTEATGYPEEYITSTSFMSSPCESVSHDVQDENEMRKGETQSSLFNEQEKLVVDGSELTNGENTVQISKDSVSFNPQSQEGGSDRNIPFIDVSKEECCEVKDDDNKWETKLSGSSSEIVSGKPCEFLGGQSLEVEGWQNVETGDHIVEELSSFNNDYGDDSDNVITKEDIQAVFLALMEDQEKESFPIDSHVSTNVDNEKDIFEGRIKSPAEISFISEENQLPPALRFEREQSPQVSIGYECHDRKSAATYGSETESEGELVPCEDKCVGTSDHTVVSDEEPLDLIVNVKPLQGEENVSKSADECQDKDVRLLDGQHQCSTSETSGLDISNDKLGDLSPSSEIPEDRICPGNSESSKEKDKISGKKAGKKKGKKNKKEAKTEPVVKPTHIKERPKLVRGKSWKEKTEKFKAQHGSPLNLSCSNELGDSDTVEEPSNLLADTHTEGNLVTSKSSTSVIETLCIDYFPITGKITDSESLDSECGDSQIGIKTTLEQMPEIGTSGKAVCHSPTVIDVLPGVTIEVTGPSEDKSGDTSSGTSSTENDDFYIVKACTVAMPSEVLTEYVVDSESSEETSLSETDEDVSKENMYSETVSEKHDEHSLSTIMVEQNDFISNKESSLAGISETKDPLYVDAEPSLCTDRFDYVQSFPDVVGTQTLNLVYSYDTDSEFDSQSELKSANVKEGSPRSLGDPSLEASGLEMVANVCENAKSLPQSGEIVYEVPCMCGPDEATRAFGMATNIYDNDLDKMSIENKNEQFCVPPLLSDNSKGVLLDDCTKTGVETQDNEHRESEVKDSMTSNSEGTSGEGEGHSQDIRSRINEIVGPRLQRERGLHASANTREDAGGGLADDYHGGREDSPLPGSSPASSSGVQGSDELSLSRSRSQSPPREESASPTFSVPDLVYESYQVQELLPEKMQRDATDSLRTLRYEGSVESTPEKMNQVDYSFRTFRDMYQINPVYLTDSDEHDDQNESDTVVPGSVSLSYDPERSITVTSIVQRWEVLQAQAVERQRQSGQIRELQRQVKTLHEALEALTNRANELTQADDIDTHQQLTLKLQEAKALQQEVSARKIEVSSINLAVHRFLSDTGYSLARLKDDVADLFRLWDEADRRVSSELTRLGVVEDTWKRWETEADELSRALRQDGDTLKVLDAAIQTGSLTDTVTASVQGVARLLNDRRKTQPGKKLLLQHTKAQSVDIPGSSVSLGASGDECLSDSGTSGYESCSSEELSERERRLVHLRRLARDLEASLHPNSQAWAAICKTLSTAETELKGLQKHCRELVVRSAETLDQAKTSPQLRRRSWTRDSKVGRASRRGNSIGGVSGRRGWMWRVVRAALPFQAALLLLFCVACLLEPNCCDHVNTLNLSLSPQVRYVHGPPPV